MQKPITVNYLNCVRAEIRCSACQKLLARAKPSSPDDWGYPLSVEVNEIDNDGKNILLEIKCPRCKELNEVIV